MESLGPGPWRAAVEPPGSRSSTGILRHGGFLLGYLLTRTYLTAAFRAFDVEQLTARVAKEAAESATKTAENRELARNQVDANALALIDRQLRARLTDETIDPVLTRNLATGHIGDSVE